MSWPGAAPSSTRRSRGSTAYRPESSRRPATRSPNGCGAAGVRAWRERAKGRRHDVRHPVPSRAERPSLRTPPAPAPPPPRQAGLPSGRNGGGLGHGGHRPCRFSEIPASSGRTLAGPRRPSAASGPRSASSGGPSASAGARSRSPASLRPALASRPPVFPTVGQVWREARRARPASRATRRTPRRLRPEPRRASRRPASLGHSCAETSRSRAGCCRTFGTTRFKTGLAGVRPSRAAPPTSPARSPAGS